MRLALVLLMALSLCGCFVVDEIEKGQEIMKAHSPNPEPEKAGASKSAAAPKSARERLAEYYAEQRAKASSSSGSSDPADSIGRCRVGGSTEFLRRSDCKIRGGTFL